jgi:ubiquinone/menaquinone biosynthesis C-methylase UbiE
MSINSEYIYDLNLLEALNDEYANSEKMLPKVKRDRKSITEKALSRIDSMQRQLKTDFKGKTVLELGCGKAMITANLPKVAGVKKAIGIDIVAYDEWKEHKSRKISLIKGDLATEQLVEEESVDIVVSGAVMEHVTKPIEMIEAIYRTLRPGGIAWMYFNLQRGPRASHRYNEIYFPWSHLLFDDSVCAEFYGKHKKEEYKFEEVSSLLNKSKIRKYISEDSNSFSWVNRMTVGEYLTVFKQAGFEILELKRRVMPIDIPFYVRFEEILGRYPALDLETDFATFIIRKPDLRVKKGEELTSLIPKGGVLLDYYDRQQELSYKLEEYRVQSVGKK